jgi:hypothetical protein
MCTYPAPVESCALPIGQFPEDPLRILRMFSGLGVHGLMVRPDAGRMHSRHRP